MPLIFLDVVGYPLPCVDHASEKLVTERLYSVEKKVG